MMRRADERRTRWRNVAKGGASAFASRAIAVGCAFLQVPIALSFLGAEAFGVWAMLQALAGFAAMLDLGMGYHLQNAASAANAEGRLDRLASVLRSTGWIATGMALLIAVAGCGVEGESWVRLLGLVDPELRAACARWSWLLVIIAAIGVPCGIGGRLATGVQQSWLTGVTQAVSSFLTLLLVALFAWLKVPAVLFLAVATALPIAVNGALTVAMLHRLSLGAALRSLPAPTAVWSDLRRGLLYLVPQLSASLRQTVPSFIIAGILGAAAVTPFNLAQRLFNLLVQPQLWLMEPLWAAYADARARDDGAWIRRTFWFSFLASGALTVAPVLLARWWGAGFLEWWTRHPTSEFTPALLGWMAVWYAATALIQPISYLLNGLGRLRGQVFYGSCTTAIGLFAMAPACRLGGLDLACLPFAVAVLVVNLPGAILDLRQALRTLSPAASQ